jgi:outer membrane receptor protein involved in Fe transport
LRTLAADALGDMPSYTVVDLSAGMEVKSFHYQLYVDNLFDKRAVLNKYAECDVLLCGNVATYVVPNQPRTIGVKFGQKF